MHYSSPTPLSPPTIRRPSKAITSLKDFKFASGETLPELRIHYRTVGTPQKDKKGVVRNAVLIGHGTGGSGAQFIRPEFAGELFGAGQPLDATKYFIVMADGIGHGKSSKPSDGLRAKFPRYGYNDMVDAQHRLLTEGLGVNHLRLVMGTSMGGMHTWVWGERYPEFMDALLPLASLPTQISGRNRVWRRIAHRCHPQRSGLERRQLHRAAAEPAHRRRNALLHGQQSDASPGSHADAGAGRPGVRRIRRQLREEPGRERRAVRR